MKIPIKDLTEWLKKHAKKIKDIDVEKVVQKGDEIKSKFKKGSPLERFIEDGSLLLSMVIDYWNGKYKKIPGWAIGSIVIALLYVLSPVDLIPDIIPGIGLVDDALVVSACLVLVEQELQKYKQWRLDNPGDSENTVTVS